MQIIGTQEGEGAFNTISDDNTEMAESHTLRSLFSYLGISILLKITMSLTPSVWYRPVNFYFGRGVWLIAY